MKRNYRSAVITALGVFLVVSVMGGVVAKPAETFPKKTITWIVQFSPGGGYDTYARSVIPYLKKYLPRKTEIVVRNITGAGGVNGVRALYKSKPDGYTIGFASYPGMHMVKLTRKIGFDPEKLTQIAQIAVSPQGIFVAANSPVNSVDDLKKMDKVKLGSTSRGSSMYAFCVIGAKVLGFNAEMVTGYGGTSEVIPAIMRGDVVGSALNVVAVAPYVKSGDLKPIVTFTQERAKVSPGVPSAAELGYDEATVIKDYKMLFGPPGLSKEIVEIYQKALTKAYADKDLLAWSEKTKNPLNLLMQKGMQNELEKIKRVYEKYLEVYR